MFDALDRFWSTILFRDFKYLLIGGGPLLTVLYHQRLLSDSGGTCKTPSWPYWLLMMLRISLASLSFISP